MMVDEDEGVGCLEDDWKGKEKNKKNKKRMVEKEERWSTVELAYSISCLEDTHTHTFLIH